MLATWNGLKNTTQCSNTSTRWLNLYWCQSWWRLNFSTMLATWNWPKNTTQCSNMSTRWLNLHWLLGPPSVGPPSVGLALLRCGDRHWHEFLFVNEIGIKLEVFEYVQRHVNFVTLGLGLIQLFVVMDVPGVIGLLDSPVAVTFSPQKSNLLRNVLQERIKHVSNMTQRTN